MTNLVPVEITSESKSAISPSTHTVFGFSINSEGKTNVICSFSVSPEIVNVNVFSSGFT